MMITQCILQFDDVFFLLVVISQLYQSAPNAFCFSFLERFELRFMKFACVIVYTTSVTNLIVENSYYHCPLNRIIG